MEDREEMDLVAETSDKIRIDRYISDLGILNRNQIKERDLRVFIGDREIKHSAKVKNGQTYHLNWKPEVEVNIEAEEIPLDIIYEDANCVVINKDQGVVVHPSIGNYHGTLVQGLLYHIESLSDSFNGDHTRPGIVHRLDKETSGTIITAKNTDTLDFLAKQFKERTNVKEYLAIIKGIPKKKRDTIKSYLKRDNRDRKRFMSSEDESMGKYAESDYVVLASSDKYSLVKVTLKTGRTHQIRVHMKYLGHPIVGDPVYSRTDPKYRDVTMMLHSFHLGMLIPGEEGSRDFYSPVPQRMLDFLASEEMVIPTMLEEHIG